MKGGRIARIRVNPQDAMGVCDVMERLGFTIERFSFDQAVRIALSSLLESARVHGVLPQRDGFEYGKMMERFSERVPQDRVRKLDVTALISGVLNQSVRPVADNPERAGRRRRYEELKLHKDNDPLNFTPEMQAEFTPLVEEFFEV